jgi:hypothetical protein
VRVDVSDFEERYSATADPWNFATSPYELERYRLVVEQLSPVVYRRCFEPACSIGVLTEMLAPHAREIVACDASETAVRVARGRLRAHGNVKLQVATLPEWWPPGTFDLIVLSELGYYWDEEGWSAMIDRFVGSIDEDGADVVAAHWLGQSDDHLLSGPVVHEIITARLGEPVARFEHPAAEPDVGFVLAKWRVAE